MQNNTNILQKLHILFVDDERLIREIVSDMLSDTVGCISLASNGQEGLDFYLNSMRPIDIVISDQTMPIMNGLDMLQKIKEHNPSQKCIMITAHSEPKYMLRAIEIGIEHFIVKPIVFDQLTNVLSTLAYKTEQERLLKEQEKQNQFQLIEHAFNTSLVFLLENIPLPSFIIDQQDNIIMGNSEMNTVLMCTPHYKKFIDKTFKIYDIFAEDCAIDLNLLFNNWKEEFLLMGEEIFFEIEGTVFKSKMKRLLSDNKTPVYLICLIQKSIEAKTDD